MISVTPKKIFPILMDSFRGSGYVVRQIAEYNSIVIFDRFKAQILVKDELESHVMVVLTRVGAEPIRILIQVEGRLAFKVILKVFSVCNSYAGEDIFFE